MKIVLTGGGTAGHIMPNLALLPLLKTSFDGIYYLGSESGMEAALAQRAGLTFYALPCAKLRRSLSVKNLALPFTVLKGIREAKRLLKKLKPDVVFSKGGYVALPVVFAAASLKIPVVAHESDVTMGLANRLSAPKCKRICLTFDVPGRKPANSVVTGTPLRRQLYRGNPDTALAAAGFDRKRPVILVLGGSSGARAINNAVEGARHMLNDFNVIHIAGKGTKPLPNGGNYFRIEFAHDIENYLAAADLVVSRAGAGTVCELLALKKPMLLIPLPKTASRGDQLQNAGLLKERGLAWVLPQEQLTPQTLLYNIESCLLGSPSMAKALGGAPDIDGTTKVYREIVNTALEYKKRP